MALTAVLDTNVIVSALNFRGNERHLFDLGRRGVFGIVISPFILAETRRVLLRKFGWSAERTAEALILLQSQARVVRPRVKVAVIERKDADNRILECALAAEADFLVTGDKRDLLPLGSFRGVQILSAGNLLKRLLSYRQ